MLVLGRVHYLLGPEKRNGETKMQEMAIQRDRGESFWQNTASEDLGFLSGKYGSSQTIYQSHIVVVMIKALEEQMELGNREKNIEICQAS